MKNAFLCSVLFVVFADITAINEIIARKVFAEETTCVCNAWGTHRNSLGRLIHNKKCDCKCKKNVTGKKCDNCMDGFYNLKSDHGCLPCLCNDVGSTSEVCDKESGECPCLDGFLGYRCNECKPDHYRKSSKECIKCNCNIYGSSDLQCDNTGQCPCHQNVTGKKCDSCKEFTHDLTKRCVACPHCYHDVNTTIDNLKQSLSEAHELISNSMNDLDTDTHEQFTKTLQDFVEKTNKLESSLKNLPHIDMTAAEDLSRKAHELRKNAKKQLSQGKSNQDKLNTRLENSVSNLVAFKNSMGGLIDDFEKAFARASNLSTNISSVDDRMKHLANQSRIMLEDIERDVNQMKSVADDAQTACAKSCDSARSFEENRKILGSKLNGLKSSETQSRVSKLTGEINETRRLAKNYAEVDSENRKKMELFIWPSRIDDKIKELASSINTKAEEVSGYVDVFKKLVANGTKTLAKSEMLKENTTWVFEEMKEFDQIVTKDVKKMNDFIDDFQNINTVNETLHTDKAAYKEKWKQYPNLRKMVDSIQEDKKTLRKEVDDTKRYVDKCTKETAKHLTEIRNIQKTIDKNVIDLEKMERELDEIIAQITNEENVTENAKNVETLLKIAEQQEELLEQQTRELKRIKEKDIIEEYEKSEKKIKDTIQKAKDVIAFLNVLPTGDEELLEIEKEMDMAEDILRLKSEIQLLEKEVKNVEEIRNSLNSIDIEPSLCSGTTIEQKGNP